MGDKLKELQGLDRQLAEVDSMPEGPRPIDLESGSAAKLLEKEPPPPEYLVEGFMPANRVGQINAPGGTGKSMAVLQLGVSLATGFPFLGMAVPFIRPVVILNAEDTSEDLSRRLHAIARAYGLAAWREETARLHANLYAVSVVGEDNRLTEIRDGNVVVNPRGVQRVVDAIAHLQSPVVVVDPLSRWRAGDENMSEPATRIVEALEIIRQASAGSVVLVHHARKGADGSSADGVRGASALVDACRWVATMASPDAEASRRYGLDDDACRELVRLRVVKSNHRVDSPELWLRRGEGGVLHATAPPTPAPNATAAQRGEDRYQMTLPKLKSFIQTKAREGRPMTARKLREYAGMEGLFQMGDRSLRGVLSRAIEEGEIRQTGTGELSA